MEMPPYCIEQYTSMNGSVANTMMENTEDMAKVIGKKLQIDGYMYVRSREAKSKIYWDCRRVRSGECKARAITTAPRDDGSVTVLKGPKESEHTHPPNREEAEAEKFVEELKEEAADHPELPPAQLLRTAMPGVAPEILSQLPDQCALARTVRRVRLKNLPPNPKSLSAFDELPIRYQKTLSGERFLLYD